MFEDIFMDRLKACRVGETPPAKAGPRERNSRQRLEELENRLRRLTSSDADTCSEDFQSESAFSLLESLQEERRTEPHISSNHSIHFDWSIINSQLLQHGLPPIIEDDWQYEHCSILKKTPSMLSLHAALQSAVAEVSRLKRHSEGLSQAAEEASRREAAALRNLSRETRAREEDVQKINAALRSAENAAETAVKQRTDTERHASMAREEAKDLRAAVERLQRHIQRQETTVEGLQRQVRECTEREFRREETAKEAFTRIRRAFAADASLQTRREGKLGAETLKPWQIVRVYERQLGRVEEEAAVARAEVNLLRQRLLESSSGSLIELRDVKESAKAIADAKVAESRAREECEGLRQELAQRPTAGECINLRRQLDILSKRARRLGDSSSATEVAHRRQKEIDAATPGESSVCTSVERLPRNVVCEILYEACTAAQCSDPLVLAKTVRKLAKTADSVQRLHGFVDEVCRAVFAVGEAAVPWGLRRGDPDDIPAILATWAEKLKGAEVVESTLREVSRHLARRSSNSFIQLDGGHLKGRDVVAAVAELVEKDLSAEHSSAVHAAAETKLATAPEALLCKLIMEFLHLFGTSGGERNRKLDSALPLMHSIHTELTAARAFLAGLRSSLGLEPHASLDACAKRVASLLDKVDTLHREGSVGRKMKSSRSLQDAAAAVVSKVAARRRREFPEVQIYVAQQQDPRKDKGNNF